MKKKSLIISIAGTKITLFIYNRLMYEKIKNRYQKYLRKHNSNPIQIECRFTKRPLANNSKLEVIRTAIGYKIMRNDLHFTLRHNQGKLFLTPSVYAFDAFLRVFYSSFLPDNNALLLHSSGIVYKNKAYVFSGPSGAGKTTITRLLNKKTLNDEIVALKIVKNKHGSTVAVYATPFWGEMGSGPDFQPEFKLASVFFLEKDYITRKELLSVEEALPKFMRCCCFFEKNTKQTNKMMNLAIEFITNLSVYKLYFALDIKISDL
ncbi:MAG: hypothetical protein HQK83_17570 [Fibrobacteria bacterium]|nr:hypothetical protein [Fibrobacteria bacterium]